MQERKKESGRARQKTERNKGTHKENKKQDEDQQKSRKNER